jgi:hypothetical protein
MYGVARTCLLHKDESLQFLRKPVIRDCGDGFSSAAEASRISDSLASMTYRQILEDVGARLFAVNGYLQLGTIEAREFRRLQVAWGRRVFGRLFHHFSLFTERGKGDLGLRNRIVD